MKKQNDFEPIIPTGEFSWNEFHRMLDRALAPYIEDGGSVHDQIIDLAKYSNNRRATPRQMMKDRLSEPETPQ